MIPFDFEYYRPESIPDAIQTYHDIASLKKKGIFYCGGTEFITFSRTKQLYTDAVIDLKAIPDCNVLDSQGDRLVIGSATSLNKIADSNLFPLFSQTVKQVADHTSRNKITIGGNLFSRLSYKEGILPLLVADAEVKVAGETGEFILPLADVYHQELKLEPGQFLVQILVNKSFANDRFFTVKKTRVSTIGYPIVSIAALVRNKQIRTAFSGVCTYPFRSTQIENVLNDSSLSIEHRIEKTLSLLPSTIVDDIQASSEYREFVLRNGLQEAMETLKEAIS